MIERLKDEIMLGYGCLIVATVEKEDAERIKQYTNSKVYELTSRMINPDNVVMDIITSKNRKRPQLDEIIDTFQKSGRSNPCGTIVMHNISELGTTPSEIAKNYSKIDCSDIGILIYDAEELSTADYGCSYNKTAEQRKEIRKMLNYCIPSQYKTNRGRKQREIIITDEFKEIYWYYETYRLAEKNTYYNKKIQLNKISFKEYCKEYEKSYEYEMDEKKQASCSNLLYLPKRLGAVPKKFDELKQLYENGTELSVACEKIGIPEMTEITFRRFIIKQETGKKGMAQATFHFFDPELNDNLYMEKK